MTLTRLHTRGLGVVLAITFAFIPALSACDGLGSAREVLALKQQLDAMQTDLESVRQQLTVSEQEVARLRDQLDEANTRLQKYRSMYD